MITLLEHGTYRLIETKSQTKILTLDTQTFAWITIAEIGEILVTSHNPHRTDNMLAMGPYRLYQVIDEPYLTDTMHLELFVGKGAWQGYLLPTGLPDDLKKRHRIIPTNEIITKVTHKDIYYSFFL